MEYHQLGFVQKEQVENWLGTYFKTCIKEVNNDSDCCFLIGWMSSVTFWDFGIEEKYARELLFNSNRMESSILYFQWANREASFLSKVQIAQLKNQILDNWPNYFVGHSEIVKEYFRNIIS